LELHFFSFVLLFTPFSNISILLVSYQLSSSVRPCGSMRHLATVCQQLNVSQKILLILNTHLVMHVLLEKTAQHIYRT
jgi:hypothetical protein